MTRPLSARWPTTPVFLLVALLSLPAWADDAPRITPGPDGGVCLNAPALLNSERDRAALKLELADAKAASTGAFVVGGVVGLVVGAVVGVVAASLVRKP